MNEIKEIFEKMQFPKEEEEKSLLKSMNDSETVFLCNNTNRLREQRDVMISNLRNLVYVKIGEINAVTMMINTLHKEYLKKLDSRNSAI